MAGRIVLALRTRAEPRRVFSWRSPLPLAVAASLLVVVTGTWVLVRRQEEWRPATVPQAARVEGDVASPQPPSEPAQQTPQLERIASDDRAGQQRHAGTPPKDTTDALRSTGYLGTVERAARPAAQVSPTPAPSAAVPSAPASESPARPKLAEKAAPAGEAQPGLVEADQAARLVAAGRTILFERNGAKGTLTEEGLVTLVLDQGTCSVDLSDSPDAGEEVRSIFRMASAPPAPHSALRSDEARVAAPSREPPAAEEKQAQAPVNLVRVLSPASRPLAAANVEQVEDRLQHLLDVTARDLIEARCGRR